MRRVKEVWTRGKAGRLNSCDSWSRRGNRWDGANAERCKNRTGQQTHFLNINLEDFAIFFNCCTFVK